MCYRDGDFLFGEHAWQEKFTLYAGRDEEDTSKHQKLRYNVIDAYRSELNERYVRHCTFTLSILLISHRD